MIVYKTTNLINGKFYIGQHKHENDNYLGSGLILKQAINKYGRKNFKREILESGITSQKVLDEREIFWIDHFDAVNSPNAYNIATGGLGGAGIEPYERTEDIRKSISEANKNKVNVVDNDGNSFKVSKDDPRWLSGELIAQSKGRLNTEEQKEKNRQTQLKRYQNPEERKKAGMHMIGKNHSEETKNKMKNKASGGNNSQAKRIKVDDIIYDCVADAMRELGISRWKVEKMGERI